MHRFARPGHRTLGGSMRTTLLYHRLYQRSPRNMTVRNFREPSENEDAPRPVSYRDFSSAQDASPGLERETPSTPAENHVPKAVICRLANDVIAVHNGTDAGVEECELLESYDDPNDAPANSIDSSKFPLIEADATAAHPTGAPADATRLQATSGSGSLSEAEDPSTSSARSQHGHHHSAAPTPASIAATVDLYRDTPVRYCGYANEVGEAFAAWLPPFGVPLTYGIAIAYVLADTYDKTVKGWTTVLQQLQEKQAGVSLEEREEIARWITTAKCVDTLAWQMLASVILPGSTIHLIVAAVTALVCKSLDTAAVTAAAAVASSSSPSETRDLLTQAQISLAQLDPSTRDLIVRTLPTLAGLGFIPLIVHPLDSMVHFALDKTYRPFAKRLVLERAYRGQPFPTPLNKGTTVAPSGNGSASADLTLPLPLSAAAADVMSFEIESYRPSTSLGDLPFFRLSVDEVTDEVDDRGEALRSVLLEAQGENGNGVPAATTSPSQTVIAAVEAQGGPGTDGPGNVSSQI